MDISTSALIAGGLVSTVGFSLLLYGKKQARLPHLVAGMLMLVLPMVVPGAMWIAASGLACLAGLWLAVRHGH